MPSSPRYDRRASALGQAICAARHGRRGRLRQLADPAHPGDGKQIILAAQKSGIVYALDPDHGGEVLWQSKVAEDGIPSGIEWGPAADHRRMYWRCPVSAAEPDNTSGGLAALDMKTGAKRWYAAARPLRVQLGTSGLRACAGAGSDGDSRRRLCRLDGWASCVPTPRSTAKSVGLRHGQGLSDTVNGIKGERRIVGPGRCHDRERRRIHQFGLRPTLRPAGQCVARLSVDGK
jgi:hypothetical protein